MIQTAFAKDITDFKKTGHCAKTPAYYEDMINEKCKELGFVFNGFILPFNGRKTKISVTSIQYGVTKTPYMTPFLQNKIGVRKTSNFKTEEEYTQIAKEHCESHNKIFLGWVGEYKGRHTKMRVFCKEHNREWETASLANMLYRKDCLRCPQCVSDRIVEKQLTDINEAERIARELCEKNNFDFLGWVGEYKGVDTKMILRCRKHGEIWNTTKFIYLKKSGTSGCKICQQEARLAGVYKYHNNVTRPTYFYMQNVGDKYIKFGITHNKPEERMKRAQKKSIYEHKLIFSHLFEKGWLAFDLEHEVTERFYCRAASYHEMEDGFTETILIEDLPRLEEMVNDYLSNLPEEAGMWLAPKDQFNEDTLEMTEYFYGTANPIQYGEFITEEELEKQLAIMFSNAA